MIRDQLAAALRNEFGGHAIHETLKPAGVEASGLTGTAAPAVKEE